MHIICGLGNPGKKYENTRHNVGFHFVNEFADKHQLSESKEKWDAIYTEGIVNGKKVLVMKPLTFMNLSGKAVAKFANFYKVPSEKITVIYDDVDLPVGKIRCREKGGPGTHNGMKSLIEHLGTEDFPRIRIGIESRGTFAPEQMDLASFVLAPISSEEQDLIKQSISEGITLLEKSLASSE